MDRNGLRPMRYAITQDGLLVAGSEAGMVRLNEAEIVEKGRVGPGQMIAVDLAQGKLYHTASSWTSRGAGRFRRLGAGITVIDTLIAQARQARELRATSCGAARSPSG
jgi:glutamate synthase (NADPH/NADH) large chain